MSNRPQVICLTPVRNEAHLLPRFLAAAETWADGIVIADQCSTDGSRAIAAAHPKVVLLDADEALSADTPSARGWSDFVAAPVGTPPFVRFVNPLAEYEAAGIELTDVEPRGSLQWDREMLEVVRTHGAGTFRPIDLWDHDWTDAAVELGCTAPEDPRSSFDRRVFRYLAASQGARRTLRRRVFERAIAVAGW